MSVHQSLKWRRGFKGWARNSFLLSKICRVILLGFLAAGLTSFQCVRSGRNAWRRRPEKVETCKGGDLKRRRPEKAQAWKDGSLKGADLKRRRPEKAEAWKGKGLKRRRPKKAKAWKDGGMKRRRPAKAHVLERRKLERRNNQFCNTGTTSVHPKRLIKRYNLSWFLDTSGPRRN